MESEKRKTLTDTWTLYAHTPSTADTYGNNMHALVRITDVRDWAVVMQHVPMVRHVRELIDVGLAGTRVHAWSLFRDDVTPEWEHPRNAHGRTLTHRASGPDTLRSHEQWLALLVECVRGADPNGLVGLQVTRKIMKGVRHVRLDAWLDEHADEDEILDWLAHVTTGCRFQLTPRGVRAS